MNKLQRETREYGAEMAQLNQKYRTHRLENHPSVDPPIDKIKEYLKSLHE
jgi:nitrate reductase assembly molybdenum cofactor insertion protein NarJ